MNKLLILLVFLLANDVSYCWFSGVGNIKFVEKTMQKGKDAGKIPINFNTTGIYIQTS